jgi:hypothetical protein
LTRRDGKAASVHVGDLDLAEPSSRGTITPWIPEVAVLTHCVWTQGARRHDDQVVAEARASRRLKPPDLGADVWRDVAGGDLTDSRLLAVDQFDWCQLNRDVVLVANTDDDDAATVVR